MIDTATLPACVDAEREVLVALLIYDDCQAAGAKLLDAEYFFDPCYAALAGEILGQIRSGDGFDPATAARTLKTHRAFPGGNDDVVSLIQDLGNEYASRAQFPAKCAAIVEAYRKRRQAIDLESLAHAARNGAASHEIVRDAVATITRWRDDAAAFGRRDRFKFGDFRRKYPKLRDPIINGIAREGQTVNVISGTKIGKSWFIYGLLFAVMLGRLFLGRFATRPGRVLLIDFELQREDLSYRIHEVAQALGVSPDEYEDLLEVWALRGKATTLPEIATELLQAEPGEFALVVWDAKYRVNRPGSEENSNDDEKQFYAIVDEIGEHTRAVQVLVHHASKGSQSYKKTTDVGAGGGAQSRAVDTHLVLREHEEPGMIVLDAAIRSFAPVEPMVLRWAFPLWLPDDSADPLRLKRQPTANEQRQQNKDREGLEAIIKALRDGPATARQLRSKTGFGEYRQQRLLDLLTSTGNAKFENEEIGGKTHVVYRLSE